MPESVKHGQRKRIRTRSSCLLVIATAVIMGGPTLRGSFVGADDHRLVLDHVLVNHPSLGHAVKLFTIPHRDLYQPLPLLSFSAEFALAIPLGLFDHSVQGGAWLFHLTNVVLHAINALLVFAVVALILSAAGKPGSAGIQSSGNGIRPLPAVQAASSDGPQSGSSRAVATIAAVLFAAHPLNMEVVAWINGRMMLLSTLFALASLLGLCQWMHSGRKRWALLTILCVGFCGLSKIRVCVPFLLLLVPWSGRRKMTRGFWLVWIACAAITAFLAVVNLTASREAGMFSGAERILHGPPLVRALLGVAWYWTHLVWPVGLASWYPTPTLVGWSDPGTLRALATVVPILLAAAWAARRYQVVLYGFGWFFVSVAATLQLVPNRNVLAADRYMYLPIIGLLAIVATAAHAVYAHLLRLRPGRSLRMAAYVLSIGSVGAMILTSWHVGSFYESPVKKCERIASLFPETPHVWERLAWAYQREGRNQDAIVAAEKELQQKDATIRSEAHQVIGTAQLALANESGTANRDQVQAALQTLQLACEEDPESARAEFRLAAAYEEVGRLNEALSLYEDGVRRAPLANPQLHVLASLYRHFGLVDSARQTYEQILRNNAYDAKAIMGLTELDIEKTTPASLRAAQSRLESLLEWMPENADAWANLGVLLNGLGRRDDAMAAYRRALKERPTHVTAAINLALLFYQDGDVVRAAPLFQQAVENGLESVKQAVAVHDFLVGQGLEDRAASLWQEEMARFPDSAQARAFAAWSLILADRIAEATAVREHPGQAADQPIWIAGSAMLAVIQADMASALENGAQLCGNASAAKDARNRLLRALQKYDQRRPGNAATYCLTARLLTAEGQNQAAVAFTDLCRRNCKDPVCIELADQLQPGPPP